jgi:peptidoglycan hydrolase-like protein with peptidoglycan-binding domain
MENLNKTPKFGDKGQEVKKLQSLLFELGFDPKGIDGNYGSNTQTAVSNFQKSKGLHGSGTVGEKTLDFLGFKVINKYPYNLSFLENISIDIPINEIEGLAFFHGMTKLCNTINQVNEAKIEANNEAPTYAECATTCSAFLQYAFTNASLPIQAKLFSKQTKYYPTHNVEIMLYRLGFKYYLKSDFITQKGAVGVMARGPFKVDDMIVNDHTFHIYIILEEVDNYFDKKMDNGKYGVIYTEKGLNVPTKGFWLANGIEPKKRT